MDSSSGLDPKTALIPPVTFKVNIPEGAVGYDTVYGLAEVFERILTVVAKKEIGYGGAWREQGWMGNTARVLSKASRLKNMTWKDLPHNSKTGEGVDETVEDLIAIAGLLLINFQRYNKWGDR